MHTMTPWVTDTSHPEWEGIQIWSHDLIIAHVVNDQHNNVEANAEHIVKCVNLHDELVKVLRDCLNYIETTYDESDGDSPPDCFIKAGNLLHRLK